MAVQPPLCRPPIPLVIVAERAVVHHGWMAETHPLGRQEAKQRAVEERRLLGAACASSDRTSAHKAELFTTGRADHSALSLAASESPRSEGHSRNKARKWLASVPASRNPSPIWGGSEMAPLTPWGVTRILPEISTWALTFHPRLVSSFFVHAVL